MFWVLGFDRRMQVERVDEGSKWGNKKQNQPLYGAGGGGRRGMVRGQVQWGGAVLISFAKKVIRNLQSAR